MSPDLVQNRYEAIIAKVFETHFAEGKTAIRFSRDEFDAICKSLEIVPPKNIGDVVYSFRYRRELPASIRNSARKGHEWIITGKGRGTYEFSLVKISRLTPRPGLITTKIPDSTPQIVSAYAQTDEQALLAKLRYNRLVDIFLGISAYSLQSHWRTTVKLVGQIEIDEVYVGVDKQGCQYVVPIQAKGGNDKHGIVQTQQDIACCVEKYAQLICRPVSAQFMSENRIAMFELALIDDEVKIVDEKHYRLVPSQSITSQELQTYRKSRG